MKKTINEVFRIIPDQRDFLKFFHLIIDEDYNLNGELDDAIRCFTKNNESPPTDEELLKVGLVRLMLMASRHITLNDAFHVFGIRNRKTGEEFHRLFGNCLAIRDGLAVLDLFGWNTSSVYRLNEPMTSENFYFFTYAHNLRLGENNAIIYRVSDSDEVLFSLISDLREKDKEVTLSGNETTWIEGEGPFLGGPFEKFWFRDGFVDKAYQPISPRIFTGGSSFSEGMAAACISGRWGYLDEFFRFAIPSEFGYAEPFSGGIARVLILNEGARKRKGKWNTYRADGLDLYELPDPLPAGSKGKFPEQFADLPDKVTLPDCAFTFWNYNGIENYHDFSISLANFRAFKGQHLSFFSPFGTWAVINKTGQIIWQQTQKDQFLSRTEQGHFAVYTPGKIQYLNSSGDLVTEKYYSAEEDPARIKDDEKESYRDTRKGAFMVASKWLEQAEVNEKFLHFGFGFYLFSLLNSRLDNKGTLDNIPIQKRRKPLFETKEFAVFKEIEEFMNGEQLNSKEEIRYRDDSRKILQFLANGMSPEYFRLVSDDLKKDLPFLQKAIRKNALILELLDERLVRLLLKKKANVLLYLQDVATHSFGDRRGPQNGRKGKIPLIDMGKVDIGDFVRTTEDALELIPVFHPIYEYLNDDHANDLRCIKLLLELRKPFLNREWSVDFLSGQAILRRNFYASETGMNKRAIKMILDSPDLLEILPHRYRNDKELILEILKNTSKYNSTKSPIRFASSALLEDSEFVFKAVETNPDCFAFLPEMYRGSLAFFLRIRSLSNLNLYNVVDNLTEKLLDDEELWKQIPDNRDLMESYASQRVKDIYGNTSSYPNARMNLRL